MSILAIDQGTTSTRALILDVEGEAKVLQVIEHQQYYPHTGWVEHDPEELIKNIQRCLSIDEKVSAIGIANQGESCLAWHADTGKALCPVIVWQDNRTAEHVNGLKENGGEALVSSKTGLPLDSYFSASKFAWIIKNIPEAEALLKQNKLRLGTTDAFFLDRLCGTFVTDITTASRTSLMNLTTGQWDAQLCDLFGVPMQALPKIVPCTGSFGTVDVNGHQVPITVSMVDQQASLYGHGCRDKGDAKITFGTGAFVMSLTGEECVEQSNNGLLPTIAWQLENAAPIYALDGGVHCASSAVNWAKSIGLFKDFSEINQFDKPPAIERNLVFVPALAGLACPHWDRTAAGLWIGLSLDTTSLDMVQAILEGVALRACEVLKANREFSNNRKSLSIDGGMVSNPYFCQFLANALECEIHVPQFTELTALGIAMLVNHQRAQVTKDIKNEMKIYSPQKTAINYSPIFDKAVARAMDWQN